MAHSSNRAGPQQQTVRFRTEEEGRLVAMMAAESGVSISEWIATAARQRMRRWLKRGWKKVLHETVRDSYLDRLGDEPDDDEDAQAAGHAVLVGGGGGDPGD